MVKVVWAAENIFHQTDLKNFAPRKILSRLNWIDNFFFWFILFKPIWAVFPVGMNSHLKC